MQLKQKGYPLLERSSWGAKPPKNTLTPSRWDYRDIVIHHAGRSYSCAVGEHGAIEQMKKVQSYDMGEQAFDDVGYHYAVSCPGEVIEARYIRFTGSHVKGDNTGNLLLSCSNIWPKLAKLGSRSTAGNRFGRS